MIVPMEISTSFSHETSIFRWVFPHLLAWLTSAHHVETSTSNEFQLEAILHDALDVEALCRHGMGDIFRRHGLEDGGLPRVVQAQDQDPGFHVILSKP